MFINGSIFKIDPKDSPISILYGFILPMFMIKYVFIVSGVMVIYLLTRKEIIYYKFFILLYILGVTLGVIFDFIYDHNHYLFWFYD